MTQSCRAQQEDKDKGTDFINDRNRVRDGEPHNYREREEETKEGRKMSAQSTLEERSYSSSLNSPQKIHKLVMFLNQRKPTRGVTSWHRMEPKGGRMDTNCEPFPLPSSVSLSLSGSDTHTPKQTRVTSQHYNTSSQLGR